MDEKNLRSSDLDIKRRLAQDDFKGLSVSEKCRLSDLARSSLYYQHRPVVTDDEMILMYHISEVFIANPFYGYRRIKDELEDNDIKIGKERVRKYMKMLGLKTFYPKKRTTIANKEHEKYPYLLKDIEITKPNQVWATDITYIWNGSGFYYLVAIIDWHSRRILSWRLSNTMDKEFCIDALNEALSKHPTPEIFNTDQGSQFTSVAFTSVLKANDIKISMDGKGRATDNIIIERFWRSIKYENILLSDYASGIELKAGITKYIEFYNKKRRHTSLGKKTPLEIHDPKAGKEVKAKKIIKEIDMIKFNEFRNIVLKKVA